MASSTASVDVLALINERPVGAFRIRILLLCALVALFDGFDTQAIAFVAPSIAAEWGLNVGAFGPVFGAGLFGLTLGALVFGPVADRVGRKAVIVGATLWFGAFSLLTATAASLPELLALRLLTGIGLGAAMPNIIALTAEYSPRRSCTTLVTLMFCGFPLGAVLGGIVAAKMVPALGWESVFVLGGVLPIALCPLLVLWMPESIRYLVTRKRNPAKIAGICGRIDPQRRFDAAQHYELQEKQLSGLPIKHVFLGGRALATIAMWAVFFSNLLLLYFLINWLPSVLQRVGFPLSLAIIGTVILNAGGIVGGLVQGRIIDRIGPYGVLCTSYLLAAVLVACIGVADLSRPLLLAVIFGAGFCVIGGQFGLNALAANYYPTAIRSTGVGWALGIGRIGSIAGPVIGGLIITAEWPAAQLFMISAIPALVSAIGVYIIGRLAKES